MYIRYSVYFSAMDDEVMRRNDAVGDEQNDALKQKLNNLDQVRITSLFEEKCLGFSMRCYSWRF